jgi:Na+/H+ antiporter NhaD/arsenite permease-like protein
MNKQSALFDFILKEWLLIASGTGLAVTSWYARNLPLPSQQELEVLLILLALFVTIKGLENSGLIAQWALRIEQGNRIALKLVTTTFFLSMFVTNDVALIVLVPLTLSLNVGRKDILVILEALAANAGSALTPFGNPQNLFIYWFYDLHPVAFVTSIAPFSILFLALLVGVSLRVEARVDGAARLAPKRVSKTAWVYIAMLLVVVLGVLRVLPIQVGLLVIAFASLFDRQALRVDYPLLLSFLFFFGLADNIKLMMDAPITESADIFLLSGLASQVMSNVPAALLFAKFTANWQALLWGTNAGGFGSLFGSLANLIAYKIYVTDKRTTHIGRFTLMFLVCGYLALFAATALYFAIHGMAG